MDAMHAKYGGGRVSMMDADSVSGKMSYIKMSWTLEATRFELYSFSITSTIFGTESMFKSESQFSSPTSHILFELDTICLCRHVVLDIAWFKELH